MKRNYFTLLICLLSVFCIAATPRVSSVNDDGDSYADTLLGHWKSNTDTIDSTSFVIFNFTDYEMQAVYYANGKKVRKGVIDVRYAENKVLFVDCEADYNIKGDTLYFCLNDSEYYAVRLGDDDVPADNDNFEDNVQRAWPKKGIAWLLSWFE